MMSRINATPVAEGEIKLEYSFDGGPIPYYKGELQKTFQISAGRDTPPFDWGEVLKVLLPMLLAMLLVPAANMAGMVSWMMEDRMSEFGVRKVFGAPRSVLMRQILAENLLLTLIGGALGLLLSYLIMYVGSDWVLTLFNVRESGPMNRMTFYTADMLFNPFIFVSVLLFCFLLNYLSAAIPAHQALRKQITYCLNMKR
jgi:putative ABC transport system permease protein